MERNAFQIMDDEATQMTIAKYRKLKDDGDKLKARGVTLEEAKAHKFSTVDEYIDHLKSKQSHLKPMSLPTYTHMEQVFKHAGTRFKPGDRLD